MTLSFWKKAAQISNKFEGVSFILIHVANIKLFLLHLSYGMKECVSKRPRKSLLLNDSGALKVLFSSPSSPIRTFTIVCSLRSPLLKFAGKSLQGNYFVQKKITIRIIAVFCLIPFTIVWSIAWLFTLSYKFKLCISSRMSILVKLVIFEHFHFVVCHLRHVCFSPYVLHRLCQ